MVENQNASSNIVKGKPIIVKKPPAMLEYSMPLPAVSKFLQAIS